MKPTPALRAADPTGRAMAPRFGGASMFYLSARGHGRRTVEKSTDGQASEVWRDVEGALVRAGGGLARRHARRGRRQAGRQRTLWSCRRTAPRRTLGRHRSKSQGAAGQSAADWSPDGKWIVAGGRDARGPALFKIPVDGGAPARLVEGKWVNPGLVAERRPDRVCRAIVVGQVQLLGVRPDGTPVELPQ